MPVLGLLVFVAGLCLLPVAETDLFFRLARGRELLSTGNLPRTNLFSFTYPDHPYPDPAWLFDLGVAWLHKVGGFPAIVLGKTAILLATFFLAHRLAVRRGANAAVAALLLSLAAFAMSERLVERPHLFSLLGCVALWWALPHLGTRRALWLFPITIAWTNLHAGSFLAPVLVAQALPVAMVRRQNIARIAGLTVLLSAALLCTPVGTGIVRYLTVHGNIYDLHPVDEFRALTFRSDAPAILFFLGCAAVVAWKRVQTAQALPVALMLILAARNVRFIPEASVILALATAPLCGDLLRIPDFLRRSGNLATFAALVITALLLRRGAPLSIDVDPSLAPTDALGFVEKHGLRDRMYNDFETGSYLVWEGYPRHRVFTDPRLPAYPENFHRLLGRMDVPRTEWTAAMDAHGVESALIDYAGINRRSAFWDPEAYALVYRKNDRRVFVRRLPNFQALIVELEIPATFSFTVEEGTRTLPLHSPPAASPVAGCEWELRLADLVFDLRKGAIAEALGYAVKALEFPAGCLSPDREAAAAAWVGAEKLSARQFDAARGYLSRSLALRPDDTTQLTNLALAFEGLGYSADARRTWERIAVLAKDTPLGDKASARALRNQ